MSKYNKKWSKSEEDFIRENYTELSDQELSERLGRTFRSVKTKRERLGLFRYFQEPGPDIKGEAWRPCLFDTEYLVSNKGRVKNPRGKLLSPRVHKTGYVLVSIRGVHKYLHVLIKESFSGKTPDGMEIDHIDCNKLNNSLYNLEFVTHQENMIRAVRNNCFTHLFGR